MEYLFDTKSFLSLIIYRNRPPPPPPPPKKKRDKGPLSLTWVQSTLRNGTKNNNTSSYMFQDHCYAFGLLL